MELVDGTWKKIIKANRVKTNNLDLNQHSIKKSSELALKKKDPGNCAISLLMLNLINQNQF